MMAFVDDLLGGRPQSILLRLGAWATAASVFAASPSSDSCLLWLGTMAGGSTYSVSDHWRMMHSETSESTAAAFMDTEETARKAVREIEITRRLVSTFCNDSAVEFEAYLETLDRILKKTPDNLNVTDAANLAAGLSFARMQLAQEAPTLDFWLRLAKAVDPHHLGPRPVPMRFVKRGQPEPQEPLALTEADIRVQRALTTLWSHDANPASARS